MLLEISFSLIEIFFFKALIVPINSVVDLSKELFITADVANNPFNPFVNSFFSAEIVGELSKTVGFVFVFDRFVVNYYLTLLHILTTNHSHLLNNFLSLEK